MRRLVLTLTALTVFAVGVGAFPSLASANVARPNAAFYGNAVQDGTGSGYWSSQAIPRTVFESYGLPLNSRWVAGYLPKGYELTTDELAAVNAYDGGAALGTYTQYGPMRSAAAGELATLSNSIGTTDASAGVVERARTLGRRLPSLSTLLEAGVTIALFAGADQVYTQALNMSIPGQGTIYRWISGENWDPATTAISPRVASVCPLSGGTFTSPDSGSPHYCGNADSYVCADAQGGLCVHDTSGSNYRLREGQLALFSSTGVGSNGMSCSGWCVTSLTTGVGPVWASYPGATLTLTGTNGYEKIVDPTTLTGYVNEKPATSTNCTSLGSSCKALTYTQPTQTNDDTQAIADAFGGDSGLNHHTAQDTGQATAECDLVHSVAATDSCSPAAGDTTPAVTAVTVAFSPFAILHPRPTEDVYEYLDRVRAKGWTGSATIDVVATDSVLTGPNGVVSVADDTATLGPDAISSWPANPFVVADAADSLTLDVNSDAAPAVSGGGGTACGSPDSPCVVTTNDSNTDSGVDFTPLTSLSFGCKFPYGALCYAGDVTGWFDVPATAPDFSFDVPLPSLTAGGATATYDVNMSTFDSYMSDIRDIETVVLWVGAVWMFCTRILGLKLGDPGEAVDEALPF